jgi:hypothetical protein
VQASGTGVVFLFLFLRDGKLSAASALQSRGLPYACPYRAVEAERVSGGFSSASGKVPEPPLQSALDVITT